MNEYLKPCPYCGRSDYLSLSRINGLWYVVCGVCYMQGSQWADKLRAVKTWNELPRRLQWTKEKPTSPGWYWYYPGAGYEPYIVRVVIGSIDGRLYVVCDGLSTMDCMNGLWAGEIELPSEG